MPITKKEVIEVLCDGRLRSIRFSVGPISKLQSISTTIDQCSVTAYRARLSSAKKRDALSEQFNAKLPAQYLHLAPLHARNRALADT